MEFNKCIGQLQRALKKIQVDVGFDGETDKCVDILTPIFTSCPEEHRRIVYYLILNSNHELADQLIDDFNIGLYVNYVPPLKMKWVVEICFKFEMHKYLLEIVLSSASGIVISLLQNVTILANKLELANFYADLAMSVTLRGLNTFKKEPISVEYVKCLNSIIEKFAESVTKVLAETDTKKGGQLLLKFLKLVNCVITPDLSKKQVVDVFYVLEKDYKHHSTETIDYDLEKELRDLIFEKFSSILQLIHFDLWISWADDFILESGPPLQTLIGNAIYDLCGLISESNFVVPNEILQCLHHLKLKPISEEELIENSSLQQLMDVVEDGHSQHIKKWYEAFVRLKESWSHPNAVSLILRKTEYAPSVEEVLEKYVDNLVFKDNNSVKNFLEVLKDVDITLQLKILEIICLKSCLTQLYSTKENSDIIEEFNKLSVDISHEAFLENTIHLLIQRPVEYLCKLFDYAINLDESHTVVGIISQIKSILSVKNFIDPESETLVFNKSLFEFASLKVVTTESLNEKQRGTLINFFQHLKQFDLIPDNFLTQIIVPALETATVELNWKRSWLLLLIFEAVNSGCSGTDGTDGNLVILLAFLCQIISVTEWDIDNYDPTKAEVNDLAAKIISSLVLEEKDRLSESDLKWLKNVLTVFPETVTTHFSPLWLTEGVGNLSLWNEVEECDLSTKLLLMIRTDQHVDMDIFSNHFKSVQSDEFLLAVIKIIIFLHPWEWAPLEDLCKMKLMEEDACDDLSYVATSAFEILSKAFAALSFFSDPNSQALIERCLSSLTSLFDCHLKALNHIYHLQLLHHFLLPLNSLKHKRIRDTCYLMSIPLIRMAFKELDSFKEVEIQRVLEEIDDVWRHEIENII